MKKMMMLMSLALMIFVSGCTSQGVNYSKSLFQHIPDDPEVLVLVNPADVVTLAEMAVAELKLQEIFGDKLQFDAKSLETYKTMADEMLKALGIPWDNVESFGFLLYMGKPVLLISGGFSQQMVENKMKDVGFKQLDNGYFEYVYSGMQLHVAADGLIMLAAEEILDDLSMVPDENRLWNRSDFKKYRTTSPLDNSLFVWSHPPDHFLSDFKYRDDLGDVSLALNFKSNLSMKAAIRVKDPQKVVLLHDIILGGVTMARGFFGEDADYGPVLKGMKVSSTQTQVETSLVLSASQMQAVKARLIDDFNNPDSKTWEKIQNSMNIFN